MMLRQLLINELPNQTPSNSEILLTISQCLSHVHQVVLNVFHPFYQRFLSILACIALKVLHKPAHSTEIFGLTSMRWCREEWAVEESWEVERRGEMIL